MYKFAIAAAAAVAASASPALANEARVEARTGMLIVSGAGSFGTVGAAAGYDVDLGPVFVGAEVSADKVLFTGAPRVSVGASARLGAAVSENDKLYVAGGYSSKIVAGGEDYIPVGAGWQHSFGQIYVKAEYRHAFVGNGVSDNDLIATGIGVKF